MCDNNKETTISDITTICIVRHGETDWNLSGKLQGREDIELNDFGRAQALQTARYFEDEHWDVMISSPLKRAYETARIIAAHISIPEVHVVEEITERSYGAASGLLPEERRSRFPDGVIPGQEGFEHLRQRAIKSLTKIAGEFVGKRIIVVSHGGFTNSVLYTISGGEFGSFKTRLRNGCINKITVQDNKWSVGFYNKTAEELLNPLAYQKRLYSIADIQTMRIAYNARLSGKSRVDEIVKYAQISGIKRIGIAYCISLQREAEIFLARLSEHFEVYSIDCKYGKICSRDLLDTDAKGLSCNPAGQAEYLAQNHTELNISFGLCLGHDIIFNQKSIAPVSTLIVKDRKYKNNPFKEFEVKYELI